MSLKRCLDWILAFWSVLLLSPVFALIALWIKLDSRGPVLFRQTRIGLNGRPFRIAKFRTMVVDAEKQGNQVTSGGDRRITRAGRFLRKSKLDELPQLLNVLWGDMSFVGPRPEVAKYVDLYTEAQRRVLSVRPGITGVSQLEFRHEEELLAGRIDVEAFYISTVMPAKLKLDLRYVENRTLAGDLRLLFQTAAAIVRKPADSTPDLSAR